MELQPAKTSAVLRSIKPNIKQVNKANLLRTIQIHAAQLTYDVQNLPKHAIATPYLIIVNIKSKIN